MICKVGAIELLLRNKRRKFVNTSFLEIRIKFSVPVSIYVAAT